MIYLASVLGFGDSLISLSLLEKVRPSEGRAATVLGTNLTAQVAQTLKSPSWWTQQIVFEAIPAFYDLRTRGPIRAVREFATLTSLVRSNLGPGDTLMLEKADWRGSLLSVGQRARVVAPGGTTAYEGRKVLIEQLFATTINLLPCGMPATPPRRVVVNPAARHDKRCLPAELLDRLLAVFRAQKSEVVLVDPVGRYRQFAGSVDDYMLMPSLASAVAALRQGDFYLGPDSFFLHLAYYYGKPFFTFFLKDWFYFAPPGVLDLGNYAILDAGLDSDRVVSRLESILQGAATPPGNDGPEGFARKGPD